MRKIYWEHITDEARGFSCTSCCSTAMIFLRKFTYIRTLSWRMLHGLTCSTIWPVWAMICTQDQFSYSIQNFNNSSSGLPDFGHPRNNKRFWRGRWQVKTCANISWYLQISGWLGSLFKSHIRFETLFWNSITNCIFSYRNLYGIPDYSLGTAIHSRRLSYAQSLDIPRLLRYYGVSLQEGH